jgi:hypothetical protein
MPLITGDASEAQTRSRATTGSRVAVMTLDGGESGGKALSADAMTFGLRVRLFLALCGRSLDIVR